MQWTQLGSTGVRVSRLAMGTMTFGGDADEATSRAIYARCRDVGINHFDTADVYNGGRSEELLGQLLSGHRDEIVLASKAYFPTGQGPNDRGTSRMRLRRACEASLRRLNTDRIDLYYLHRFDDPTDLEESLRGIEWLVQTGKVLYPALSNFAAWQIAKSLGIQALNRWAPAVAMQPMYNLVKRQAEVELLPMALSERVAVFPYSPLAGGLLTGKFSTQQHPEGTRLQDWPLYKARYGQATNFDIAERFTALAKAHDVHPVTLAVSWVMAHPAVTAPLLGARSLSQLDPALAAADFRLDPELLAALNALSPTPPPATDRSEEGLVAGPGATR
ncbi:MAG: aldo/keto reductase [Deltaproteobacteria bacterium]|nr:aldo/keto reductase [Deltaproteobacteria bacterium]